MLILGLNSKLWITLGPVLVINLLLLASLAVFSIKKKYKREEVLESVTRHQTKILSQHVKEWWVFITDPIALFFVKIGLRPSSITGIGFIISLIAAILFSQGLFGYAGWVMVFGATFDIFDGRVARLTGQETRSGAFYDAVLDRFSEGACFLGLAYYFRNSWVMVFVIAGLIGSMLVSYTKARGESVQVQCKIGTMQRPERIVYIGVSSLLDPVAYVIMMNWTANPFPILLIIAIIIIAVMTNYTAVQRMIYIMNILDTEDNLNRETIPQLITKLKTQKGRESFITRARYGYDRSRVKYGHLLFFLLDGVSFDLINKHLEWGNLPNIKKYVVDRGGTYKATSTFPSTTGPSLTPFVTGCFPGTCNVPAARWFDRDVPSIKALTMNRFRDYMGWGAYAMDHDISGKVKTIYEYSRKAVNIFGMVNRGCGFIRDPGFFRLYSLYPGRENLNTTEIESAAFEWLVDAVKKRSDYIFYSFPSIGISLQNNGTNEAIKSLERFDKILGYAVDILKREGIFDDAVILIGSDYSLSKVTGSLDLTSLLSDYAQTLSYPASIREWSRANIISLLSGRSSAHLYLKSEGDWQNRSFIEDNHTAKLLEKLLEKDQIDIVAGRNGRGEVVILSKKGRIVISEKSDGRIEYRNEDGDLLVLNSRTALETTVNTMRPDFIMQILQSFRSSRSGDLIISAAKGCSLDGNQNGFASGSLSDEHLLVPLLSSIPLKEKFIRTVDVFSIALNLLGIDAEHRLDGVNKFNL